MLLDHYNKDGLSNENDATDGRIILAEHDSQIRPHLETQLDNLIIFSVTFLIG